VCGAAGHDHQRAGAGHGAAPVAELLATLDRVRVQHPGRDAERAPVAEPQVGADPGPERELGVARREHREVLDAEVGDPDHRREPVVAAEPGSDDVGHQVLGLGEVVTGVEGEVDRGALDADAVAVVLAQRAHRVAEAACGEAVPLHRGQAFEDDAWPARRGGQRLQVREPADGVDDPRVGGRRGAVLVPRPPRRQHDDVTVEAAGDVVDLGVRAHGERVAAETELGQPLCPAREPAVAEAVAVALGDRDKTRTFLGHPAEVVAPAVSVDVEHQTHDPRLLR